MIEDSSSDEEDEFHNRNVHIFLLFKLKTFKIPKGIPFEFKTDLFGTQINLCLLITTHNSEVQSISGLKDISESFRFKATPFKTSEYELFQSLKICIQRKV